MKDGVDECITAYFTVVFCSQELSTAKEVKEVETTSGNFGV